MSYLEKVQEKLISVFHRDLPGSRVHFTSAGWQAPSSILAHVESPQFVGLNQARRQAIVWKSILENLDPMEQRRIDFIYTSAPSETTSDG